MKYSYTKMLSLLLCTSRGSCSSAYRITKDVCPAEDVAPPQWTHIPGKFDSIAPCEASSSSAHCTTFTWNKRVKECYCSSTAKWKTTANDHCDSGCLSSVAGCGTAPTAAPTLPGFPVWVGPRPAKTINASAGLAPVAETTDITVYAANQSGVKNAFGVYNHGPIITHYAGHYFMSWYNAPIGEDVNKRSVYASSTNLHTWTAPAVLFPTFTQTDHGPTINGEENGPWTILGVSAEEPLGRLYSQSGTQDAGEHHEGIISVMRRVGVGANATHPGSLGPPFWLNRSMPTYCKDKASADCTYPTYLEMDDVTRRDAEQLLASFIRTTVVTPDSSSSDPFPRMVYNERSLYMAPGTRTLVLLLRGQKGALSASLCELPKVTVAEDHTLFSCRPGIGDAFMNIVELVANSSNTSDPRVCEWSTPQISSLPDSGSRTCAARFPTGADAVGVYLVGNQIEKGRDPVTLSVSKDGVTFDRHWSVRYTNQSASIEEGGSCPRWVGHAKGCGFQYPGAMIDVAHQRMIVSYSIGKEDIALTVFPLTSIQ